jgi:hypothetical protein
VVAVHLALIEERDAVLQRLAAINEALGAPDTDPAHTNGHGRPPNKSKASQTALETEPPLIRLVLEFTRKGPRPVVEILEHLRAKKYKFKSGSPLNELLAALEKSFAIKDYGGKIGPVVGKS